MQVIKVGGALGPMLSNVCNDIHTLVGRGETLVVVHGGSLDTNELADQLGQPIRYLTAPSGMRSRYTDPATLDVLTMAMLGRVKARIVAQLVRLGVRAVGLSGLDAALVTAEKTPAVKAVVDDRLRVVRDDMTGRVTALNKDLLDLLLTAGYVPVISPPVLDPQVGPLNTDADRLAALVARTLGAESLILLSNVPGLLRDPSDPGSLVPTIPGDDIDHYLGLAQGRMRVKLLAAYEALTGGVPRVVLGDGRIDGPISAALAGLGTTLVANMPQEEIIR
ncbi:MAG TPA: [LysW]-aminoadipate kinase [Herpetosiphonaceae bacterium]